MEPAPTENPLLCPVCDYNLTGLPENRCPECGNAFDPAELAAIVRGDPRPICYGPTGQPASIPRIWWMAITCPRVLARQVPPAPIRGQLVLYSLACYLVAGLLFCLPVSVLPSSDLPPYGMLMIALFVAGDGLFACCICEIATAFMLNALLRPTRAAGSYRFWRGFTHCTSGFTVFTALWGAAALWGRITLLAFLLWPAAGAIFLWWAVTLCLMIVRRSRPGVGRWIACLLIAVLGVGAIFLAYLVPFFMISIA